MDRNLGSSGVTTVPFLHATDSGVMSRLLVPFLVLFSASAFEVLDVGAPRTGTQSMYDALGILGLNTLHSGYRSDKRIPWCEYLFANGSLQDAMETLEGYDAAMDEPFQLVYEEIMEAFPEAKFVLTISDPERWFDSFVKLIAGMVTSLGPQIDHLGVFYEERQDHEEIRYCAAATYWGCEFANFTEESKRQCLEAYQQHNARVQQVIPAHRLLVFNFTDGWAPLAHFLGKPIPDEPFPHVDLAGLIFEGRQPEPPQPVSFIQESVQLREEL
ncbi:unnamed protein product [Symbiodinium necroappetens]|uniref:Uncharacterized protein n=1 Tax=Symbiodinium necroappetens TaxID=1628268 RepID=A0A813BBH8_9DINO|nr:unnamed protein product [Symbiodinium necroappetens]